MNLFSKVGPGQRENLSSLVKARFGLLLGGKQSPKREVLFEFQGSFLPLHWTNHSGKLSRSGGLGKGWRLVPGVTARWGQLQGSAFPQSMSAMVRISGEGEEWGQVPGVGMTQVLAHVQLLNSLNPTAPF